MNTSHNNSQYETQRANNTSRLVNNQQHMLGFGYRERMDMINLNDRSSEDRIFKKLYQTEYIHPDPINPKETVYIHFDPKKREQAQMARRMDRRVIKLEAAYGSERQFIVVKRNQDLIVRDVMEEINKVFRIPMDELVVFHKGTNLCDHVNETLENLGVENNHPIRVCRDEDLVKRSPRGKAQFQYDDMTGHRQNQNRALSPVSYLKEIAPDRVPDPTPYKVQMYNQSLNQNQIQDNYPRDVLKLYVTYGSDREYILVHGRKPLMIYDLKLELNRVFKVPVDKQAIVFKGYYLHEYLDDAPLEAFGLENNSPVSLWFKGENDGGRNDLRHPRQPDPSELQQPEKMSPRNYANQMTPRWISNDKPSEVLKLEVQHGSDRHLVILKGINKNVTVSDLQNEVLRLTAVPVQDQRLFYRAQELHLIPNATLKECAIENNASIKLVGEPSKMRYSNYFGRMKLPDGTTTHHQEQAFRP